MVINQNEISVMEIEDRQLGHMIDTFDSNEDSIRNSIRILNDLLDEIDDYLHEYFDCGTIDDERTPYEYIYTTTPLSADRNPSDTEKQVIYYLRPKDQTDPDQIRKLMKFINTKMCAFADLSYYL
jgi:hypothetical protein